MDKYENLGLVGEGSYGIVIKCRNRETGRIVAVKKFLESEDDKTVKKIALREIRLLKQLRHENLVNLLEVWRWRRRWFLVFEFVDRTILDELEEFPHGLEPGRTRRHLYQILRAIAFCHQHNIIHRDIKPENVLVTHHGVVKLCDFGFARVMSATPGETYTDYIATRWYRAPELLVGDTKYDKAVDVWAIGCLFVEMTTGTPLFPGDSDIDQLYHIIRCLGSLTPRHLEMFCRNPMFCGVSLPEPTQGESVLSQLTGNTADFSQKCLQMDPEERPACSQLLSHDLFTSDGFHTRFMLDSSRVSKTPKREDRTSRHADDITHKASDDITHKASDDITERAQPESSTEDHAGHKMAGAHNSRLLPIVEGGATQDGNNAGVMSDGGGVANQEGRIGAMHEGRGGARQERCGELRPPSPSGKPSPEGSQRPSDTSAVAVPRPSELAPRNCPGARLSPVPPITAPPRGPISLRSTDTLKRERHVSEFKRFSQQSVSSHLTGALNGKGAPEHSAGPDRSSHCKRTAAGHGGKKRADVRFPELRNTVLPQNRAEGKHRKKKETRIPSIITGDVHPCRNI